MLQRPILLGAALRVSALLSAPRCDTTQLLFIPIRLAPIYGLYTLDTLTHGRVPNANPNVSSEGEQERWRFSSALLFSCIFLLLCLPYYGISRLFLWLVLLSIRLLLFHKCFQLR